MQCDCSKSGVVGVWKRVDDSVKGIAADDVVFVFYDPLLACCILIMYVDHGPKS